MENMLDRVHWIHCNQCFELFVHKRKKIYLISCYHVICETCLDAGRIKNRRTCPICKRKVGSKLISNDMSEKYLRYFHDKPWADSSVIKDVISFQITQKDHFQKIAAEAEEEMGKVDKEIEALKKDFMKIYEELLKMRTLRAKLEDEATIHKMNNATM